MIYTNVTSLITAWIKPPFLEKLFSLTHVTVFVPHLQAAAHPSGLPPNLPPAPISFPSPSTRIGTRALQTKNSRHHLAFALLSTTHSLPFWSGGRGGRGIRKSVQSHGTAVSHSLNCALWSSIQYPEVARVLLNHGTDTNAQDNNNQTVSHLSLL